MGNKKSDGSKAKQTKGKGKKEKAAAQKEEQKFNETKNKVLQDLAKNFI